MIYLNHEKLQSYIYLCVYIFYLKKNAPFKLLLITWSIIFRENIFNRNG